MAQDIKLIELIAVSRFLTDYFWEYKALSVLHAIISLVTALFLLVFFKRNSYRACNTDKAFLVFFLLTVFALAQNLNSNSAVDFLKFSTYLSFYFVGRLIPASLTKVNAFGLFSLMSLIGLALLALAGVGYQSWGNVSTFTGGYFFKTDLAISSLIFLAVAFVTLQRKLLLALALLCAAYLVFKSNARIALPLVIIIPAFVTMALRGTLTKINAKAVSVALIAAVVGMALFTVIDFRSLGMLGFDFTAPFSAANTQGRSVIWSALLQAYSEAGFTGKLIGMGFDADARATSLFSESVQLEGVRAHNSYLYLLICMGVLGSFSFYYLIYSAFLKVPFLLRHGNKKATEVATLSSSLLILFIWLSLTTEVIIRPQLMVPLFLFTGLHVQHYLKLKKAGKEKRFALSSRA